MDIFFVLVLEIDYGVVSDLADEGVVMDGTLVEKITLLSYPGESQEIVSPLPLAPSGKCRVNFELRMLRCDRRLSFDSVLQGVFTEVNSRISFDLDSGVGIILSRDKSFEIKHSSCEICSLSPFSFVVIC